MSTSESSPQNADAGEFDWDKINDDENLELCLIRVPDSVKPKYLENIQLDKSISSVSPRSALVGILKRKHTTFDIWSVGDDADDDQPVGGEELKGLSCLLPRKSKKGKLYPASKPFAHHLLISAQAVVPTPCAVTSAGDSQASISSGPPYKNPPRQSYPKEVLKHQFMPYGSLVNVTTNDSNEMDIDDDNHEKEEIISINVDTENPQIQPQSQPTVPEGKKVKVKKRKVENTSDSSPMKKFKKSKKN